MPPVVRSYVAAGVALMGAGAITAAQIVPPLNEDESRVVKAAVSLAAAVGAAQSCSGYLTDGCDIWATPSYTPVARDESGSAANIPANLLNAVISVPRAFVDAVNDLSYALEATGSWWVYTPTNVLGFDPADPPKATALANLAIPFKPLSNAVGEQVAWWARANLPMNAGCTGSVGPTCAQPLQLLGAMFQAPPWVLTAGYQFPELYNPVSDAEGAVGEEIPGSVGKEAPWSEASVKLDPSDPANAVLNYLLADPALNTPETVTLTEITTTLQRLNKALDVAFNPFVPMSFLLKGWPYTAFTPLVMPLVPLLCPTCNPEDPGLPPVTERSAASSAILAATEQSARESTPEAAVAVSAPGDFTAEEADDAPATGDNDHRTVPKPAVAEPASPEIELDAAADVAAADDAEPVAKQRRGQNRPSASENRRGSIAGATSSASAPDSGEQAGE